jgi:hypothetical protein
MTDFAFHTPLDVAFRSESWPPAAAANSGS